MPPDWFIAARVRRLERLLGCLPEKSPGIADSELVRELRSTIDGPRHEIRQLIDVLIQLGLLHAATDHFWLSRAGRRASTLTGDRARQELAELIIQSGFLYDQARQLIEASTTDGDGLAQAETRRLRASAPQLLGLLRAWPDVVGPSFVRIPPHVFAIIDTPWSLAPLPQIDDGTRKAVGTRAEAYSYQVVRLGAEDPSAVTWVALDDENLGYDIEDRSVGAVRRIEVKASQRSDVRFFLSENEYVVAHEDPHTYELHFWGGINLNRRPDTEFGLLRAQGFPLTFEDLSAHLADQRLQAVPTKYRVTPGPAAPGDSPPVSIT